MYLDQAKKQEIFGQYGKSNTDTGSAESQIALFSYRISHLTEHLKKNRKDYTTARSLTQLVGKRRALLNYLYDRDINRYRAIVKALGLRKESTQRDFDDKKSNLQRKTKSRGFNYEFSGFLHLGGQENMKTKTYEQEDMKN